MSTCSTVHGLSHGYEAQKSLVFGSHSVPINGWLYKSVHLIKNWITQNTKGHQSAIKLDTTTLDCLLEYIASSDAMKAFGFAGIMLTKHYRTVSLSGI